MGKVRDRAYALDSLLQIGAAVVTLFAAAVVVFFLVEGRQRTLASAGLTTQNLARLLDENLTAAFDKIDLALRAVQDELERPASGGRPARAALEAVMARQRERAPDVVALRLLDAKGDLVLSAPPLAETANFADRDFFSELRAGAPAVVSKPVSGRITQGPVIVFGRRLSAPDGAFDGAVIGTIDLDHVAGMLALTNVGTNGVVVLRGEDFRTVARTDTRGPTGVLDQAAVSDELRRLVASGATSGTYEALAPSDQTWRTLTFRRLEHHPFYIIVGLAHDDQLAEWRRVAATAVGLLLSFVAFTWFGAVMAGRAVRRQRSAEERLAATLQSMADGVIAIDVRERIVLMNGVAERATGWGEDEARGRAIGEVYRLIDRRTREARRSAVTRALETTTNAETPGRHAVLGRDGNEVPVAETGAPIRDRAGAVTGAVLVFRDVAAVERAEEELTRVQKVESLAVLAGGIAHDFNNLLTGITGNLSLVKERAAPEGEDWMALADAETAALRARSLTHQLLTFSRGGAPVKSRVDLSAIVEEAARFAAHGAGTALRLDLTPGLLVDVDPGQIAQVVQNLVINGIQAMDSGGALRVETRRAPGARAPQRNGATPDLAVLTVADGGPGIAAEVLPRIFDPFFTTKIQGKGLGLAICHSIATRHGGAIDCTSSPGAGATFRVTLPASESAGPGAEAEGSAPAPGRSAGHRILVMDDEAAVRRIVERALRPLGYEVVGASEGREAVTLYEQARSARRPFSVVVMDLTIPGGMGGLEALERLRVADPDVVAIASSGYSNDPVMADAPGHGFRGALSKPYTVRDLREAVDRALRRG